VLSAALGVVVLFGAIFLIFVWPNKHTDPASATNPADTIVVAPARVATLRDTAHSQAIRVTLPNGKVIDAFQGGMEDQLAIFLNDPNAKLHKKNGDWFNFTKVDFASNSASLLLESEVQLKNIVAILAAFPKAKVKIGGYSDNAGDPSHNIRLSQQRADNIYAKLLDLDAKPSQLKGAKGYGSKYPAGDNAIAVGRNMNRRMSIDVVAK
jgi:outer membrane protein OmpA-like peptidoglycan-associated protein